MKAVTPEDAAKLRFAATPFPEPTRDASSDVEKLAQWFTEIPFVRDFVYRNPTKERGKEFSDIFVLFHDTAIIVQIKTQTGDRPLDLWIKNNLNHALKQLNGSARALKEGRVNTFWNDLLGALVPFDQAVVRSIYGLVVLAIQGGPTEYEELIEAGNTPTIDTNVLSLNDLIWICRNMSTAADFIVYLELRHGLSERKRLPINNEENTMSLTAVELPGLMRFSSPADPAKYAKSVQSFRRMLSGALLDDPDYRFGF